MKEKPTYRELEEKVKILNSRLHFYEGEGEMSTQLPRHDYSSDIVTALMHYTDDCVLICDEDGEPQFFNKAYARIMKEVLDIDMKPGVRPHEFLDDPKAVKYWDDLRSRALSGERFRAEYTHAFAKDNIRTFEVSYSPIESNNRIRGFIELTRDITEQKEATVALQQSEKRQRQIIEDSGAGYFFLDLDGRFQRVNSAWLHMHKYETDEEIIGHHFSLTQVEGNLPDAQKNFEQLRSGKPILTGEFSRRCKDGAIEWHTFTAKPVKENEKIIGLEGFLIDITDRKRAEEALKESEERYRTIFINSPIGIFRSTFDGRFLDVNPSLADMLGYDSPEDVIKNIYSISEQIYVDDEKRQQIVSDQLQSKDITCHLNRYRRKDGSEFIANLYLKTLRDVEGKPVFLEGIVENITERTQAEDALRESEERFRTLFNNALEGILVAELKSKNFQFANPAICQMLGYSEDELIGMNVTDIHPEESLDHVILEFEAQARGEKILAPNIPCRRKDGQILYTDVNTGTGKLHGVKYNIGFFTDITARKQAEEALLASEEKYRSMMEAMKNDAYICSPDFRIEYMNPRMISRVGHDATGEYCYKAIYGFDEKCSWCVFEQILQGEHVDYEVADPRNNCYYSVTNSAIYHSSDHISQLTIFLDITEKKAAEAQLQHARKMESIGTMAGGIAHDFNNILYIITGNAELAMEDIPEWNPIHENLKEIKGAGLRAAGIIKQLLNFNHQSDQKFRPTGAVTVIKDAMKFLCSTIPATIEIQKDFPDKDVTIFGDPVQINQVMMNLCINAAQVMGETGGILDISLENISIGVDAIGLYPDLPPGDFLKITVRDTGPGIGPEIIGKIFDPYFTTKEVGKGSGMGLAVVHGIVKNHNGAITVDSKPGKGAIFTILLPVVDEKPVINAKDAEIIPKGNGEKILFIDDEVSIVKMTERMLKRLGYEVETKTNPLEALERFQSKPDRFDLVITDMTMPKMTGAKLAKRMKEIRFDIPIVICTGCSPLIDEEKSQSAGISGYVKKPVVRRNIARIIRKVLDEAKGSAHAQFRYSKVSDHPRNS